MYKKFKQILSISLFSLFIFTISSAFAAEPVYERRGAAIRGYDTVAYWTEGAAVRGSQDYTYEYKGSTWHFASAANRDLFAADPERYAPQYNGFCAYAMGVNGKTVRVNPEVYTIEDGKLYLNFNRRLGNRFDNDIDNYIQVGMENWQQYAE